MNKMIPSELIHTDKNGDAVIGKNLEVDGSTKLNGGLEPIHDYVFIHTDSDVYRLIVLFEKYDSINETYCGFGFIEHEGNAIYPGVFDYSILNGAITYLHGVFESKVFDFNGSSITESEISTSPIA